MQLTGNVYFVFGCLYLVETGRITDFRKTAVLLNSLITPAE